MLQNYFDLAQKKLYTPINRATLQILCTQQSSPCFRRIFCFKYKQQSYNKNATCCTLRVSMLLQCGLFCEHYNLPLPVIRKFIVLAMGRLGSCKHEQRLALSIGKSFNIFHNARICLSHIQYYKLSTDYCYTYPHLLCNLNIWVFSHPLFIDWPKSIYDPYYLQVKILVWPTYTYENKQSHQSCQSMPEIPL